MSAGSEDEAGNGTPKKKIAMKARPRWPSMTRFLQRAFADAQHSFDHDGEHGGFQAEEQGFDEADVAVTA